MMNRVKITAIILVILAGLASSYLILKNPKQTDVLGANAKISELSKAILDKNPIQWVESAKEQIATAVNAVSDQSSGAQDAVKNVNLTDLVSQSMLGGMQGFLQSENASTTFNPDDPQSQEAIQNAINNIKNPFIGYDLSVDNKDIKISQSNSFEAKSKYLTEAGQIILNNSTEFYKNPQKALDGMVNSLDVSGVKQIADAYAKILNGFLNIEVSSDYLDLHKRYIILLKKAKGVYEGLANYDNDPVRASLLVQLLQEIAEGELAIKQEYYQKSLDLE